MLAMYEGDAHLTGSTAGTNLAFSLAAPTRSMSPGLPTKATDIGPKPFRLAPITLCLTKATGHWTSSPSFRNRQLVSCWSWLRWESPFIREKSSSSFIGLPSGSRRITR